MRENFNMYRDVANSHNQSNLAKKNVGDLNRHLSAVREQSAEFQVTLRRIFGKRQRTVQETRRTEWGWGNKDASSRKESMGG